MSDSKMVSVPRELLERLAAPTFTSGSRRTSLQELRAVLAAPAEDVRAVDEPACWTNELTLAWFKKPNSGYGQVSARKAGDTENIPLYRHAQRKTAIPEQLPVPEIVAGLSRKYAEGWNACLDEFKRLNP